MSCVDDRLLYSKSKWLFQVTKDFLCLCLFVFFLKCSELSSKLPNASEAHTVLWCESKFLLYRCLKWKPLWNLSLSREETSALLSWRTTSLFQISQPTLGQVAEIAFLSPKCLGGFVKTGEKWWFCLHVSGGENCTFIMEGRWTSCSTEDVWRSKFSLTNEKHASAHLVLYKWTIYVWLC